MFDPSVYSWNQSLRAVESLTPYLGKHVAWSFDGLQVLAVGDTAEELYARVQAAGITEYVTEYIPRADSGPFGYEVLSDGTGDGGWPVPEAS